MRKKFVILIILLNNISDQAKFIEVYFCQRCEKEIILEKAGTNMRELQL